MLPAILSNLQSKQKSDIDSWNSNYDLTLLKTWTFEFTEEIKEMLDLQIMSMKSNIEEKTSLNEKEFINRFGIEIASYIKNI